MPETITRYVALAPHGGDVSTDEPTHNAWLDELMGFPICGVVEVEGDCAPEGVVPDEPAVVHAYRVVVAMGGHHGR